MTSAFLEANGHDLDAEPKEIEHVFRHVAGSEAQAFGDVVEELAGWVENAMRPLDEED